MDDPCAEDTGAGTFAAGTAHRRAGGRWLCWARLHMPFLLIALFAGYLLTINVATPWATEHEDDGLGIESIAINYIRFGLGVTKGQDYLDQEVSSDYVIRVNGLIAPQGQTPASQWTFFLSGQPHPYVYGHHPPLLGLTVAGSLLVFGYNFWAVRLVPILYSICAFVLLYAIACAIFDVGVARLASFLFATFPIMAYFGRNVAHEAPTLCWALLLLFSYIHWRKDGRNRWLMLAAVSICIGGFYGWPLCYFAAILIAVDCLSQRRFCRPLAIATVGMALLTFTAVIAQLLWALDGNVGYLVAAFTFRNGTGQGLGTHVPFGDWLATIITFNVPMFGLWCAFAAPCALVFLVARFRDEGLSLRICALAISGLWGLSHMLIFPGGAYVHDYWQFYLLPFYALSIGWMFVAFGQRWCPRAPARAHLPARLSAVSQCLYSCQTFSLPMLSITARAHSHRCFRSKSVSDGSAALHPLTRHRKALRT